MPFAVVASAKGVGRPNCWNFGYSVRSRSSRGSGPSRSAAPSSAPCWRCSCPSPRGRLDRSPDRRAVGRAPARNRPEDRPGLRLASAKGARRRSSPHPRTRILLAAEPDRSTLTASSGSPPRAAAPSSRATTTAVEQLARGAGAWRGPPLADFAYESFAQAEIGRLEEAAAHRARGPDRRRPGARRSHPAGRRAGGPLPRTSQPRATRESARARALSVRTAGRRPRALPAGPRSDGRRTRPGAGPELQELERAILAQDPALEAPARPTRPERLAARARVGRGAMLIAGGGLALLAVTVAVVAIESGAGGGIAVSPNSVAVIDVKTNRLVDQVAVGRDPTDVSAAGRSVWIANTGDDTVSRIDDRTRRVGATIAPHAAVDGMAAGQGAVWTSDNRAGRTKRIDPSLRRVDWSIRTLDPGGRTTGPVRWQRLPARCGWSRGLERGADRSGAAHGSRAHRGGQPAERHRRRRRAASGWRTASTTR